MSAVSSKIRIDKWLWYARIVKTRSLAQTLVKAGKVRVDTVRSTTPSRMVETGNVLTVTLPRQVKVLRILDCGTRRGPASEAQALYQDLSPPPVPAAAPVERPARLAVREEGAGRPTKKQRRELDRLRNIGDMTDDFGGGPDDDD